MNQPSLSVQSFAGFTLDRERGLLERAGSIVPLRPKLFTLLSYLANHQNCVVEKEELFSEVWGKIVVTDDTLTQSIKDLRRALGDTDGTLIQTFPKRGYLFKPPTDVPATIIDVNELHSSLADARPSIGVLPLRQAGSENDLHYFADGMAEDLITGLSRIPWLHVIARNTSFRLGEIDSDAITAARQFSIRYLLEGSVQRSPGRVRLSLRLVDVLDGTTIWADKFDGALIEIFDLQDKITERVVGIVEPRIQRVEIEKSRRKHPKDLTAYDLYLRAIPHTASQMPDDARVAISYLQKALSTDPEFASAHALLAWCHEWCFTRDGFRTSDKEAALQHARRALVSSTDDATALAIAGFVIAMLNREFDAGLEANRRALEINHSCATAMYLGAITSAFAGRPQDAIKLAERALRASPLDILAYQAHFARAIAEFTLNKTSLSIEHFNAAIQLNPHLSSLYFTAAAANAQAGYMETAERLSEKGLAMEPNFRLRLFDELMVSEVGKRFVEGGRKLSLSA